MAVIKRRIAELRRTGSLRRYPELNQLQWRTCTLRDAPLDAISAVIQSAWQRAYGNRIRIAFSPEFFRYVAAGARHSGLVTFAEDQEGVCGAVLGLPLDWVDTGPSSGFTGTLTTGLSTTARWEGAGLVETLLATHAINLIDAGHTCSFHWRANETPSATMPQNLRCAKQIPLYAKPLRCAEAIRRGGLSWWQGLGFRYLALRHPVCHRLPDGFSMASFTPGLAGSGARFLNEFQPVNELRRCFYPETLQAQCTFAEGALRGAGWAFFDGNTLAGMIWGYVNPVDEQAAYFAIDGAVFHPSLRDAIRLGCLRAAETYARDALACFALLVPGSVCRMPLDAHGYVPVRQYTLGAAAYQECPKLTPGAAGNAFIELR